MEITKGTVATLPLPEGKPDHIEWDDDLPGFGVRIRSGNGACKRTYIAQYRIAGQQRRSGIGDVRRIGLEDARKVARKLFAQVELGIDPGAEKAKKRAEAKAAKLTLGSVADRYLTAKQDVLRPNTFTASKRYLTNHWKPLRDRPIDAIKRADVAARLQEIVKAHGRTSAARARGVLSAMYGWSMREGLCEANPVIATNDPSEGIQPRERVLSDGEVAVVWRACRDDTFGRIVRLLLLTGCRREEIGGLRWSEANLDSGVVTIPGTRTKNRRTLELTLPPLAVDILRTAPRIEGRDFIFGERGAFCGWSYATAAFKTRIAEAEGRSLAPWTLHDLRRTTRTGLGRFGSAAAHR